YREHPDQLPQIRKFLQKYWDRTEYAEAEKLLEGVLAEHPDFAEAHYSYAFTLQCAGSDLTRAVEHYSRALELRYPEFWVRYGRGATYFALGDREKARRDIDRAHELDPKHAGAMVLLDKLR